MAGKAEQQKDYARYVQHANELWYVQISSKTLAHFLGITVQRVRELVHSGVIPDAVRHGRYELGPTLRGYIDHHRARSGSGPAKKPGSEGMQREQLRLATAKADIEEMEARKRRGELVEVKEVVADYEDALVAFKQKLVAMPAKAAPMLAAEDDPDEVKTVLMAHLQEAIDELSTLENYRPASWDEGADGS